MEHDPYNLAVVLGYEGTREEWAALDPDEPISLPRLHKIVEDATAYWFTEWRPSL